MQGILLTTTTKWSSSSSSRRRGRGIETQTRSRRLGLFFVVVVVMVPNGLRCMMIVCSNGVADVLVGAAILNASSTKARSRTTKAGIHRSALFTSNYNLFVAYCAAKVINNMRKFLNLHGLRLGMREWGANNSHHSKRILALHGWLDNANSFYFLGPYLAERGYHVVALDHAGHGHSDHVSRAGNYSLSRSVGLTREAMDALEWETSHVVGHSMGASISLMYSSVFPEKVEKLVLIEGFGPLVEPPEATTRNLRRAIDSDRSMRLKGTKPKLYPDLTSAIDARVNIVKSYPGKQYISREAARALVARYAVFSIFTMHFNC